MAIQFPIQQINSICRIFVWNVNHIFRYQYEFKTQFNRAVFYFTNTNECYSRFMYEYNGRHTDKVPEIDLSK